MKTYQYPDIKSLSGEIGMETTSFKEMFGDLYHTAWVCEEERLRGGLGVSVQMHRQVWTDCICFSCGCGWAKSLKGPKRYRLLFHKPTGSLVKLFFEFFTYIHNLIGPLSTYICPFKCIRSYFHRSRGPVFLYLPIYFLFVFASMYRSIL